MDDYDYLKNDLSKPSKEILKRVLMQEGLINKAATMSAIERFSGNNNFNNVYFGTGISKPHEISVGVPFDFLVYPLIANKVRNSLGEGGHIHHLIADNHALINMFDSKQVKKVASEYRSVVENIVDKIGIKDYHVYLSSEVATDKNYKLLLEKAEDSVFSNKYAKFEAADIEYFRETRDALLKLGWMFSGDSNFDEQSFDNEYKKGFGDNVVSIYTACGKKFIDKSPNTVPYTLYQNEVDFRFIISPNENILKKVSSQKCSDNTKNMLHNHYKGIVRLFEDATQKIPLELKTTWDKIQYINQILTN